MLVHKANLHPARIANVAAAIVILLSGALSTAWAFIVPIFQAPDEPAHFDYAISILSAHRLVTLADGPPAWIVSPYTKYLMQASDFERIAWHSSMRVPPGYGTRAYFAGVGNDARRLRVRPGSRISYIAPLYPFGFYAAEALWLGFISLFGGSIVTLFFAARLLCVFFLMVGLYYNYRTALNLGVPSWIAVAIVAAIGVFPLASFVSSYVQPDNLSYVLVSAALYYASKLRAIAAVALPTIAALGVAIGLLAVTKYQFFLATALPAAFLLGVTLSRRGSLRIRLAAVAAFIAPTLALLSLQYFFVDAALHRPHTQGHISLGPAAHALALGAIPFARYLAVTAINAFTDFFVAGGSAATYWQVVGWFDTPIVIFDDRAESLIRAAISLATLSVAVVLGFFVVRNMGRLGKAAVRGHARQALGIASSDPVLNSYLLFVAFMFALYVLTNNAFGAEGRHWYPYLFPAFLCFVWYAPRLVFKRGLALPAGLACSLLLYCVVASSYALTDVLHRYYSPPSRGYAALSVPRSTLRRETSDGVLWPVETAEYHVNGADPIFSFPPGARLLVEGSLKGSGARPSEAGALLDGRITLPVLSGQYQYRVAEAFHSAAAGYTGFFAPIEAKRLAEGPHLVTAFERVQGRDFRALSPSRLFFVTNGKNALSPSFARVLAKAPVIPGTLSIAGACGTGVVLLTGSVNGENRGSVDSVWLDVDGVPLPARYTAGDGSFVATVPAPLLTSGQRTVAAFALRSRRLESSRISQEVILDATPAQASRNVRLRWSDACNDPLRQLAGT